MTIRPDAPGSPRPACCRSIRGPLGAAAILIAALALAGCASTPQASAGRDAQARQFGTHPGSATLYVYRADRSPDGDDSVLYVDNRLVGATLPGTYFRIDLDPGGHMLRGYGHDNGGLNVEARNGELVFVALSVMGGNSRFTRVDDATGKRDVARCCALLENWAPGQRPLLH